MTATDLPSVLDNDIHHSVRKRLFDIVFSLVVLVIGAPLYFFLMFLVKVTSRGPVFFAHQRVGRGGRVFHCYKFRTMYTDAEDCLQTLLVEDKGFAQEWFTNFKVKKDPRITGVGRLLRKTSLDEIPQFWNVLKGDLSVVGPRPIVGDEAIRYFGGKAAIIWRVRPGITGPWQISGRSDTSHYRQRVRLDERYVRNWSFLEDLKIIAKTLPAVFFARGAY